MSNLAIEFTVNMRVEDAIDQQALREDYGNDPLKFIRHMVQEEGLMGIVNEDFEITTARCDPAPDAISKPLVPNTARAGIEAPPHECQFLARAIMDEDRDWWIGRLVRPVPEWPKETHCLHMKTPIKNVVFLCNAGDFEQLLVLANVVVQLKNLSWLESMTEGAQQRGVCVYGCGSTYGHSGPCVMKVIHRKELPTPPTTEGTK